MRHIRRLGTVLVFTTAFTLIASYVVSDYDRLAYWPSRAKFVPRVERFFGSDAPDTYTRTWTKRVDWLPGSSEWLEEIDADCWERLKPKAVGWMTTYCAEFSATLYLPAPLLFRPCDEELINVYGLNADLFAGLQPLPPDGGPVNLVR
ncbi:MAG: hypothetical protein AAF581_16515 [Planctomycetota bacterium]